MRQQLVNERSPGPGYYGSRTDPSASRSRRLSRPTWSHRSAQLAGHIPGQLSTAARTVLYIQVMLTPSVLLERALEPVPGAGQHKARHAGRPARRPGAPADQQAGLATADAEQPALLGA